MTGRMAYRRIVMSVAALILVPGMLSFGSEPLRAGPDEGWAALWRNDIAGAVAEFERALEADDKDIWARRGLVVTYLSRGYDRDVIDQLEKLASLEDADALDYLLTQWVYKAILTCGRDEERFLKICERFSKNRSMDRLDRRVVLDGLMSFSMSTGDTEKTEKAAKELNRLNKWSILGPFDNTSMSGHGSRPCPAEERR